MNPQTTYYQQTDPTQPQAVYGTDSGGDLSAMQTQDVTTRDLLGLILLELRKMNIHLASLSGEEVADADIEGIEP